MVRNSPQRGPKKDLPDNGMCPKVVALTRCRLLWAGLLSEKFRERPSSLPTLALLKGETRQLVVAPTGFVEGGDVRGGGSDGGCWGRGR